MYGNRAYGTTGYGAIDSGEAIVAVFPDALGSNSSLKVPTIKIEELADFLGINATLKTPTVAIQDREIIIKINDVDVSDQVDMTSLNVENNLYSDPDLANLRMIISSNKTYTPQAGDEIEITDTGIVIFSGILIRLSKEMIGFAEYYDLQFKDWTEILSTVLVAETYVGETVADIIADIFSDSDLSDFDGTTNVSDTTVIANISFDNIPVTEALDQLAKISGKNWYVSPDKAIYFFANDGISAPFDLDDDCGFYDYSSLIIDDDYTQIRNRVTVKGKGIEAVTVEDLTSQSAYGLREYFVRDDNITATNEATQYANAILAAYKDPIKIASFNTKKVGLFSGQQIDISSANRGINETLNIERVEFIVDSPKRFYYKVKATSERLGGFDDLYLKQEQETSVAISDQGSLQDISFTAIDDETIQWSSGTIRLSNGTTYSIDANASETLTGDHVIYFDPAVSTTELQISTTFSDGIGAGKIPLCYATKSPVSTRGADIFPVSFGGQIQLDGSVHITERSIIASNIAANSITANEISANTITANKMNVSVLSAITAYMGTLNLLDSSTGGNLKFDSTNRRIAWIYGVDEVAYGYADSNGDLYFDADNKIILTSDGAGDYIQLDADDLFFDANGTYFTNTGNWFINEADQVNINYNHDNDGSSMYIDEDSGNVLTLDNGKDATFQDDVKVEGDLDVDGSKNFKIDHPLKPITHYLFHSAIESPERYLMYKGKGEIKNGKCNVDLPDYFEALNKDFDYILTAIGQKMNLWISKEVKNNKFEVSADVDGKFTWVVYGTRNDKYSQENPYQVEVEKDIKGYSRPELYGENQSIYDKIRSENIRRKERGEKEIAYHNKKGFVKVKRISNLDSDAKEIVKNNMKKAKLKSKQQRRKANK